MTYIDGFLAAVPTGKRAEYLDFCEKAALVFKDHGALSVVDGWGDDVPDGEVTSFPLAVKCQDDETVAFGWVIWPSREARDAGMEKVMADPRMAPDAMTMPFDGKRMVFGGFETIYET